jgi:5'-methylthioadenosine phosphorylase
MSDFLDFTKVRAHTFFETGKVVHTDVTHAYSEALGNVLAAEMSLLNLPVSTTHGVYVAAEGPRFESPQEVHMYAAMGGSVVGMTGVPEVTLANEAGLEYQTIAIVTNYAAGMSGAPLTHQEVLDAMARASTSIGVLLRHVVARVAALPEGTAAAERRLDFLLKP